MVAQATSADHPFITKPNLTFSAVDFTANFDQDADGMPNLAELVVGGNPNSPSPTFLSADYIEIPERQNTGTDYLIEYTVRAISPCPDAFMSYSVVQNDTPFVVDASTNKLALSAGDPLKTWPVYDPNNLANNTYTVTLQAYDGTRSSQLDLTVVITDMLNLTVAIEVKTLHFLWDEVRDSNGNPAYYKLLENPDGQSGFLEISNGAHIEATDFSHDIAVHLFDRLNARYRLEAYSSQGDALIGKSEDFAITDTLINAVGYVKAPGTIRGESFGGSVSLSDTGDTLAVGALGSGKGLNANIQSDCYLADGAVNPNPSNCVWMSGTVYVFQRNRVGVKDKWGPWRYVRYFKAPNADRNDEFGSAVNLSGDGSTLAVGVPGEDNKYTNSDLNGIQQADCWLTDGSLNPNPINCAMNSGAVYIIQRDPNGFGNQDWQNGVMTAYLKAPNASSGDKFGKSISLSADGNTIAVGVPAESSGSASVGFNSLATKNDCGNLNSSNCVLSSGAVYIYQRDSGGFGNVNWSNGGLTTFLKAPDPDFGDGFGWDISFSTDGSVLVVSAPYDDSGPGKTGLTADPQDGCVWLEGTPEPSSTNCAENSGAVYLYKRDSNSTGSLHWMSGVLSTIVKPVSAEANDEFGYSLSLSAAGDTLVVSARGDDSGLPVEGFNGDPLDDCTGSFLDPTKNCSIDSGAVYVIQQDPNSSGNTNWSEGGFTGYLKTPTEYSRDHYFGRKVRLSSDASTLVVGSPVRDNRLTPIGIDATQKGDCNVPNSLSRNCARVSGAVYIIQRDPNGSGNRIWSQGAFVKILKAPYIDTADHFGSDISISGDGSSLAVGAEFEDSGPAGVGFNADPQDDCLLTDGSENPNSVNCEKESGAVYLF